MGDPDAPTDVGSSHSVDSSPLVDPSAHMQWIMLRESKTELEDHVPYQTHTVGDAELGESCFVYRG